MTLQEFLTVLLARRRLIFKVLVSVVFIITAASLVIPKTYTGIASVVVDAKATDPVTGLMTQGMIMPSYLATQVDVISSERVCRRVVKMLEFEKVPELVENWKEDTNNGQTGTFDAYYAYKLSKKLKVEPSRESNVIEIKFKSDNPKTSARVANAFAQAYLQTNLELMVEPASQYSSWFTGQVKQIRDKMADEQAKFADFQKSNGIVSMDEKFDVEAAHLSDLSSQLTVLQAQLAEARTRQRDAEAGNLETIPDVVANLEVQSLRNAIAAADGKIVSATNTLGPNHPQVKEQKAELETLKAQLKIQMTNIAESMKTTLEVAQQKVDKMQAQVNAQRERMLELKKQRDEAANLQSELAATQLDYNSIRQRLTQSNLQSQSPQTDVAILTPAYDPIEPSFPKIPLNVLASIVLGLGLGVGAAFFKERQENPIRSVDNLVDLGFPVLGSLLAGKEALVRKRWWQFWRPKKKILVR